MRLTIGTKFALTVSLGVVVSCLVTSGVSINQEFNRYLQSRKETLLGTAGAFSAAIAGPLAAGNEDEIFSALRGIGQVPHLLRATARNSDGKVLGQIGYAARLDRDPTIENTGESSIWDMIRSQSVAVLVPVIDAGVPVGELELLSDTSDLGDGLAETLWANLAGGGIALLLGLLVAGRLQRSIAKPLTGLTHAMRRVRDRHDYEFALPHSGSDEIGVLIAGFNAMLSDIRERDSQLVQHRNRLELDVEDRTRELVIARDGAEQANAAKSTFLATMSHEIRTPMTGLLVMAELLASGELPPRSKRYAEVISKSGTALLAIINDILDFSKIEAGKLETERVRVDVRDIVGTVLNLFHARAVEKGLDLAARFATDVPMGIEGDPVRLQQVISNLINNALKFTKTGFVDVEVVLGADERLQIVVTDTGIGIPPDKLHRIFQAFSQADGSTTREFGGTGLGLAISSRLAEAMGGRIEVRSEPGAGSSFTCSIPVESVDPTPAWPEPRPDGGRVALVLVEAPATARALAHILGLAGFTVRMQDDPADCEPDLLVIDQHAAVTMKRRKPGGPAILGIADPGEMQVESLAASSDLILRKPILEAELKAVLERLDRGEPIGAGSVARVPTSVDSYAGATVLVVDDTAVNREVMVEALRRFDIVPHLATNGLEALAAAQETTYDLVFMDGSMPELDGFEACRRLRAHEAGTRRTPVIALTAHVVGVAADAWREAGMDGVLHKPFTMKELQISLASYLGGRVSRPVAAVSIVPPQAADDAAEPLLDETILDEITSVSGGTQQTFAKRVFTLFIEHAPLAFDRLVDAQSSQDHEALAAAAHALKSMSLNIGARQVGTMAGRIERFARAGEPSLGDIQELDRKLRLTVDDLRNRIIAPSYLEKRDVA